jgi:hypothetical protein
LLLLQLLIYCLLLLKDNLLLLIVLHVRGIGPILVLLEPRGMVTLDPVRILIVPPLAIVPSLLLVEGAILVLPLRIVG